MLVARYDRAIADVIAAAGLERLPDLLAESAGNYGNGVPTDLKSLTAYDPRAIAPLLRALPDAARKPPTRPRLGRPPASSLRFAWPPPRSSAFPERARPREAGWVSDSARLADRLESWEELR